MQRVALQKINGKLVPHSQEDKTRLAEFKEYQILRADIYGVKKPRSYDQLKLFWACCRTVAENTDDKNWNEKDKVAEQVKLKLQFIKSYIVHNGAVHIITRSISYQELPHIEACNFFDRAFDIMAKKIGISVDELTGNANRG